MNMGDFSIKEYRRITKNCQHVRHCNPFERIMKNGIADLNGWGPCYGPCSGWPNPTEENKMPDPNNTTGMNPTYLGNSNPTPEQRAKRVLYNLYGYNSAFNRPESGAVIAQEINDAVTKAEAYTKAAVKPDEKPRHAVGVSVLLVESKQLLLGRRKNNVAAGYLSTPGGRLELEESVLACASREFHEETGAFLYLGDPKVIHVEKHSRFGDNYVMFYVLATRHSGTILNTEPNKCEGWDWYHGWDLIHRDDVTEPFAVLSQLGLEMESPVIEPQTLGERMGWDKALDRLKKLCDGSGYIHSSVLDTLRRS